MSNQSQGIKWFVGIAAPIVVAMIGAYATIESSKNSQEESPPKVQVGAINTSSKTKNEEEPKKQPYSELILGKWYIEQPIEQLDVKIDFKGNIEYFPNKSTTSEGEFLLSRNANVNGRFVKLVIAYNFTSTGEWSIHNNKVISKTTDTKSRIDKIEVNGIETDKDKIPEDVLNRFKIENLLPQGISSSDRIISISESKMELESDGTVLTYKR